jgi:ParB-like chromosome segregation protein Spo0J
MNIDLIKVGDRFRRDMGDIDTLAESIRARGLLQPIVVDPSGNLIAGERRLQACVHLGWRDIQVNIVDLDADGQLRAQEEENVCRKAFLPSEAVAIKRAVAERERVKAKQRMVAAHASPGNLPEQDKGRVRDKAAAIARVSGRTLEKAERVVRAAEANPSLAPIVEAMDRTGKVDPAYQKVRELRSGADLVVAIRKLAGQGYTAQEMRGQLPVHLQRGVDTEKVHRLAHENDITLARTNRGGKINNLRVIRMVVDEVTGTTLLLRYLQVDEVDPEQAREWADEMASALRPLKQLARQLSRRAGQEHPQNDTGGCL